MSGECNECGVTGCVERNHCAFKDEIARLTAEVERLRANNQALQDAGLLDAQGNLRKIIGTLPVTADGVLAGTGGIVYVNTCSDGTQMDCVGRATCDDYDAHYIEDCYSTREAAERAAKGANDA